MAHRETPATAHDVGSIVERKSIGGVLEVSAGPPRGVQGTLPRVAARLVGEVVEMAKTERTFKVIENRGKGYCVAVYRNGKERFYPNVSRRRIEALADCIRAGRFETRPFTGGGLGYVAEEPGYRKFAESLLNRIAGSPGSPKIALIKALRIQADISLRDAKDEVEKMFDFSTENPVVR